jgi:hypothetical protein
LKILKILTLVDDRGGTVCHSKCEHRCKVPLGEISGAIIEVGHGFINNPGKGEELKNPATNWKDKAGTSNVAMRQGVRICGSDHIYINMYIFVLILKAYFMPIPDDKGAKFPQNFENVLDESARTTGRNQEQCQQQRLRYWQCHGP